MSAVHAFSNENRGAGFYGAPHPSHKTDCPNSNNPFGHSPECRCRRALSTFEDPDRARDEYLERAEAQLEMEFDRENGWEV